MSWLVELRRREPHAALSGSRETWNQFVAECEAMLQAPWFVIVEWFNELDRMGGLTKGDAGAFSTSWPRDPTPFVSPVQNTDKGLDS